MSKISLKNFVDINIVKHIDSAKTGIRETIVLFTNENNNNISEEILVNNESEISTKFSSGFTNTKKYLKIYFENGGNKVLVITNKNNIIKNDILSLNNEYIVIAFCINNFDINSLSTLVESLYEDTTYYGINEKIFLHRIDEVPDSEINIKNAMIKYSSYVGGEMTTAAYLSKINVYGEDSVYDYAFTEENKVQDNDTILFKEEIELTDAQFKVLMQYNINTDIYLSNSIRNCGGNLSDGNEVTNEYVRIILHQTVTNTVIALLTEKIKNSSGISKLYSTISQELEKYKVSGYLTNDEIWTADTLVVNNYTIIEKGTPLTNGYIIKILPLSSLNSDDKLEHKAPKIYIILSDQYGIRKITINGEII